MTKKRHGLTFGTFLVSKPTTQYADMDSDSRALIEQMLAEEEYYYGQNTMNTMKRPKKGTVKRKGATKKSKVDNGDHDGKETRKGTRKTRLTLLIFRRSWILNLICSTSFS
jgi:hypothetical protein